MALCTCKCLNIILESEKIETNVDIEKLELTPLEQRDIFFNEKLILCLDHLKTLISQPALVGQRTIGRWILHSCIACGQSIHAVRQDRPNMVLIKKSLQTTTDKVNQLKKSSNFSTVFNILVPEVSGDVEMKENIDTNNLLLSEKKIFPLTHQALGSLTKQLSQTLQTELEAIEESVRQFKDQKYAEYEVYREKAQRDHKILASIVNKARTNIEADNWKMDTSLDNGPPSPQLPPLQRRRLSSIKDAKKIPNHNFKQLNKSLPPEEDFLDAEEIFDLEGMESHHDMGSDQDDYDSESSNDEGLHIMRRGGHNNNVEIARSLPINMPKFDMEKPHERDLDEYEEPAQDIAASIKALAKSVHGDVFELPRPRFSTQI